ncbi:hypothetical protein D3C76_991310 [compost metagenome]
MLRGEGVRLVQITAGDTNMVSKLGQLLSESRAHVAGTDKGNVHVFCLVLCVMGSSLKIRFTR